jgi:ATP-dependent Lon protease
VLQACHADLGALKSSLVHYLDNELKTIVFESARRALPTAAFQRVEQRAALHAQEQGHPVVTGAHALFAIFPETRSPAVRCLAEQGVSQGRAELVAQGLGRRTG